MTNLRQNLSNREEWGYPASDKGLENITAYRQNEEKTTN